MLRAAVPASRSPALSPTRGSAASRGVPARPCITGIASTPPSISARSNGAARPCRRHFDVILNLDWELSVPALIGAEHGAHPIDLHPLIGVHIGCEGKDLGVLAGARRREEILDHRQGAGVVLDHAFEEETIERRALRLREPRHLLGREHPGHQHRPRM